jgi:hypothetical protein
MALPVPSELLTMDVVYLGSPFVEMASKSSTVLLTMDTVWLGSPFVRNDYASSVSTARSWGFVFG